MAESGSGGGIIGTIFDTLSNLLQGVDQNIQIAFNYTGAWLNNLLHNLVGMLKSIGGFFSAIWKFLKHAWENYIKKALDWLIKHFRKWIDWLRKHVKTIIDHLKKWKKWYDTHILPFQQRQIAMIQAIRRFLGILRLFHVKWAAKADQTLADLQNRIEESISLVRGTLNQIINTLAIAFDPRMLLTSNVLFASLLGNLAGVKRIFGFGDGRLLSASEQATIQHDSTRFFTSNVRNTIAARSTTGLTEEDQANKKAARDALASATGAPLPF